MHSGSEAATKSCMSATDLATVTNLVTHRVGDAHQWGDVQTSNVVDTMFESNGATALGGLRPARDGLDERTEPEQPRHDAIRPKGDMFCGEVLSSSGFIPDRPGHGM
jgi:hypothetical protein